MTSRFQLCNNVTNTEFIVNCELNLLSNREATLEKCFNSNVVVSTLLQRYELVVVRRCDLTPRLSKRCIPSGKPLLKVTSLFKKATFTLDRSTKNYKNLLSKYWLINLPLQKVCQKLAKFELWRAPDSEAVLFS